MPPPEKGIHRRVAATDDFLHVDDNKTEIFSLLTMQVIESTNVPDKQLFATFEPQVIAVPLCKDISSLTSATSYKLHISLLHAWDQKSQSHFQCFMHHSMQYGFSHASLDAIWFQLLHDMGRKWHGQFGTLSQR